MSRQTRERVCNLCFNCINSCKEQTDIQNCIHYKKMLNRFEYMSIIKENNINVKKLCNSYNISYNIMMNMLHGRQLFNYKYATVLNNAVYEVEEFIKYYAVFEGES